MRVLHLADLHLGIESYGRRDPGTGLSTRLLDALRCLDTAITHALSDPVDLVVIAGDVFDRPHPDAVCQREFDLRMARLSRAGIPAVIILGDHDLPGSLAAADGLAPLTSLRVEGVTVCRVPQLFTVETGQGEVEIAALPAPAASDLVSGGERAALNRDEVAELARRRLVERLASLDQARSGVRPSLLAAHLALEEAVAGSEREMPASRVPAISRAALAETGFDYVALGHAHRYQDLASESGPPVVYAGSPDRLGFGDEGVAKGFVIAELEEGGARHELLPTPARRFVTVRASARDQGPTAAALAAIGRRRVADAIVRVSVSARDRAPLDRGAVRAALADAQFIGPISVRPALSQAQSRAAARLLEAADPLSALEAYLRARRLPVSRVQALLQAAAELAGGD